jgi:hypothetical protein
LIVFAGSAGATTIEYPIDCSAPGGTVIDSELDDAITEAETGAAVYVTISAGTCFVATSHAIDDADRGFDREFTRRWLQKTKNPTLGRVRCKFLNFLVGLTRYRRERALFGGPLPPRPAWRCGRARVHFQLAPAVRERAAFGAQQRSPPRLNVEVVSGLPYWQANKIANSLSLLVGSTGIEPVTPTMSR